MFKGDKNLWLQFANTMKLRVLMRLVPNGDQTYVSAQIARIVTQGSGFLSVDALVQPGFSSVATKGNPFWAAYGPGSQNNNSFCANVLMIDFLDSINDPRVNYFYTPLSSGTVGGEQLGNNIFTPSGFTSSFGPGLLKGANQPGVMMLASTSLFMQAEAVQRGLLPGNAAALYKQGVESSFGFLGVTANPVTAADAYLSGSTNGMVNFASSTNALQTILYQKWISECCIDGLEAYCDYRRTGFPFIAVPSYGTPGTPMPQKLLYPQVEYTQNPVNVNAQKQTADDIFVPVFWAQ
jgi:hypothetical protein